MNMHVSGATPDQNRADEDEADDSAVAEALRETPKGAFALAALTVAALLVAWFAIYFLVFIPRGVVG